MTGGRHSARRPWTRAEPRRQGQRQQVSPRLAAEQIGPPPSRIRRAVTEPQTGTRHGAPATPPLADLRVVDLSTWIGGAYCTKLLADGGAEVIKVEPPEGDPLRRWSASGAAIPSDTDGALFNFLAASKQSVVVDGDRTGDLARLQRAAGDGGRRRVVTRLPGGGAGRARRPVAPRGPIRI